MAIVIPSKNIYDIKNDIIRENFIKSIEVNLNKITEKIEENSFIMNYEHQVSYDAFWGTETPTVEMFNGYIFGDSTNEEEQFFRYKTEFRQHTDGNTYFCLSGANTSYINLTYDFKIPKDKVTKGNKVTLNISRKVKVVKPQIISFDYYNLTDANSRPWFAADYRVPPATITTKTDLEDLPTSVVTEVRIGDDTLYSKFDEYTIEKDTRIVELFELESDPYNYHCNLLIPALRTISIAGYQRSSGTTVRTTTEIVEYIPEEIFISVYGTVYNITKEDGKIVVTNPNSNGETFAMKSNPLMQFAYREIYRERISKTLNAYAEGKEIITLKCSISDYFDESGNKVISTEEGDYDMTIPIYTDIIPMYINGNNNEVPIAKYNDGTPKVFKVLQSKILYDGAVWQTILAQEV